jgi:predicted TIM-barrel fold metal-dependent hydrolase
MLCGMPDDRLADRLPGRPNHVDVHQHAWTAPLLEALARRDVLPFVRRTGSTATVYCAGEQPYAIDLRAQTTARRTSLVWEDGLDLALIAPSSPVAIEALPRDDARELIEAHLAGVAELGERFAAWGPVALDRPLQGDVDDLLACGCVGISIPAGAMATPDALTAVEPLIARAEALAAPVFVHPGPGRAERGQRSASLTEPLWWAAMTDYVAQMQAAWLTFVTFGRRLYPELRILFAMLAGGAPLLSERLAARGGPPIELRDPLTFYETSSYGEGALHGMIELVGLDQLLYGSDRPVVDPVATRWDGILKANAARLLAVGMGDAPADPAQTLAA